MDPGEKKVFVLNSRQLQYVIALSQLRSFSQAAEKLGISQPALSKQIINLETELGVRLFDRDHVPMTLTPAGEYFVAKARNMLYEEDQLLRVLEQFKSGENGRLDIGVTPFRSSYLMPEVVRLINARYPGVRVVLHEAGSAQLRRDAAEGKFDFAVVNLPVDEAVLEAIPLEPDRLMLAVPNSMLDRVSYREGELLDFAECRKLPFVVVGQSQEMRQLFDRLCSQAGLQPHIAAEVVGVTTAWAMARAGVGATLLPYQFVNSSDFDRNLTLIPIRNDLFTRQPAIVLRRGQYVSEYTRYAMALMQASSAPAP